MKRNTDFPNISEHQHFHVAMCVCSSESRLFWGAGLGWGVGEQRPMGRGLGFSMDLTDWRGAGRAVCSRVPREAWVWTHLPGARRAAPGTGVE